MLDGYAYSRALRLHTLTLIIRFEVRQQVHETLLTIDELALNQIWSEMTTEKIGVSYVMQKI